MRSSTLRRRRALPAAAALSLGSLVLAGCSAANETPAAGTSSSSADTGSASPSASSSSSSSAPALAGNLSAAGASSITAAMEAWVAGFQTNNPDANITYDPAGSGAGRDQFIAGAVPLAGSDAYLDAEEVTAAAARCDGGNAVDLPVYVSPIAVVYNLAGVSDLKLSAPTIAKIFDQQIKDWSDPAITADNGTALPAGPITVVNRGDKSGTTENFTEYLSAVAPQDWTYEPSGDWPVSGGEAAQGTSGVIQAVTAGAGYIGYADESQAGSLGKVSVKVGEEFVAPSAEGAAAVVDASPAATGRPTGDVAIDIDRTSTAAGAYPVVLVSYMVACTKYQDPAQAALVKGFLNYVVSTEGQDAAQQNAGSAPISDQLRGQVQTTIDSIG